MNNRLTQLKPGRLIAWRGYLSILLLSCISYSCQKDFLDTVPDKGLLVPEKLDDFQALLDNSSEVMNVVPFYNTISDGDFVMSDEGLDGQLPQYRNLYTWASDIYDVTTVVDDWYRPYKQVFYANVVLDGLKELNTDGADVQRYQAIKGSALYYRALAFYNLAQEFAQPYDAATADKTPGIPVRLESDVNIKSVRGTLANTYTRIVDDLQEAETLLPDKGVALTRPGKSAARALLARVYQAMENYEQAAKFATSALELAHELVDYNDLDTAAARPFPIPLTDGNPEMIYYSRVNTAFLNQLTVTAEPALYNSYDDNDLRKRLYFTEGGNYKGTYLASAYPFGGLAVDELYLIRAECSARKNDADNALADINTVLIKRWKTGTYVPYTVTDPAAVLQIVLNEQRKELVARGLRWTYLRRLNKDSRFAVALTRSYKGSKFTLPANDLKYTFAVPDDEISGSGIEQNKR
ncbi:RagB/SusD family nutrient uptake outer membrane protein [Pedobacter sp. HMF7647]|uniref:RagB/SusD family nutrient uptake outer membrane protein n=1 Tax=Hufsiella arboris TaxID=2695275 RepID=A0A7K1Y6A3_9SPHI|nr:RagB/SusD family nutrient uptake outer membrane protein [Hufsiella arboris]MXV49941.1 RagB/SusD family nutrient uptake outer membrane protein [Hufsiella arboris]